MEVEGVCLEGCRFLLMVVGMFGFDELFGRRGLSFRWWVDLNCFVSIRYIEYFGLGIM